MRKILFISNVTNRISNFSIPSIFAAQELGYQFHMATNLPNFNDDSSKYNVILHHIDIDRNPLSIKNIKAYRQMLSLIRRENFDVIHCNTPAGGVLGRLCGWRANTPKIIYTAHGFHFYKGAPLINWLLYYPIERWLANYTDAIITINKEDYRRAKEFYLHKQSKVYYVPGVGIDLSGYSNVKNNREKLLNEINVSKDVIILISVGELNKNKNNEIIIKAIAELNNPRVHYIVCGIGPLKKQLSTLAQACNIESQVHFLGYRNDIKELLKSSDIFVLPSYR
jgi:glycosyltransferase involved in cell wall biosynthesis